MNSRLVVATIAAAVCLLVTACGGADGTKAPGSSSGGSTNQMLIWGSGQWDSTNWS